MTIQRFASVWDAIADTPEEAENMKFRSMLMKALKERIDSQHLTQANAAKMLRVTQPRVSDLLRGKSSLFAIDALVNMAAASGLVVELKISKAPTPRKRSSTSVRSRVGADAPTETPATRTAPSTRARGTAPRGLT
jgi:predicted XRE-type DNA-binding protein